MTNKEPKTVFIGSVEELKEAIKEARELEKNKNAKKEKVKVSNKDLKRFEEEYKIWIEKINNAMKKHNSDKFDSENSDLEDILLIDYDLYLGKKMEDIFNEYEYLYDSIDDMIYIMKKTGFIIAPFIISDRTMLLDTIESFENGDYDVEDGIKREYFNLNNY